MARAPVAYPRPVTLVWSAVLVVVGFVIGLGVALVLLRGRRAAVAPTDTAQRRAVPEAQAPLDRVVAALPEAAIVVDPGSGAVIHASRAALTMGLVLGTRMVAPELEELARASKIEDRYWQREVTLHRSPATLGSQKLIIRTVRLSPDLVLILARDVSGTRQLDAVRRDFVANVSHELKTPVGALSLLAEAITMASDDPESVRHFAGRIQQESTRLGQLVSDLIDLSRIEVDDPLQRAETVAVDQIVRDATEAVALVAQSRQIEVVRGGSTGLQVHGIPKQLVAAVRNLLANAVAYSPAGTKVGIATRASGDQIEISVTDRGIGIPEADRERIFERFYRVDQARSRATGGTGLGLAIVKHVCQNHGGSVSVWSVEGEGSTFTLRLPAADRATRSGMLDQVDMPILDSEGAT